ncbi:antichymotrypsin-2 isoform X5 [Stomoxys calcitrans]|uniref:antichymotrypsin-2 isoform X5 n=1 Tax=Stomoxys calcitrans TaxID=35570 RepID=UPI0027E2282C|nr:antichymotrypsin-2 isoform X5 [Stomoxys calcitrans]
MKSAVNFKQTTTLPTRRPLIIVNLPAILSILAFILISLPFSTQGPHNNMATVEFSNSLENFGVKLFSELAKTNPQKNIVFSPFSIQTCVAMARMGAAGDTAAEMDKSVGFTAANEEALADNYHSILAAYQDSNILKIANKIYIMKNYETKYKFNELLTKKFFSGAENIDFGESQKAANTINGWVESKTNNLIKDLVSSDSLNSDTRLVLLNAIHFKGEWVHPFPEHGTREKDFYLDETNTVKVQMMHISENFRYGEFPELDATALEMPYKNSDLSMLVILPNSRTGLAALEEKLKTTSLHDLTSKMYSTKVIVDMPKFKAEFSAELKDVLTNLGMGHMFSSNADFSKMLKSPEPLQVSKVIHKAFIEVNEKGTEAAAATGITKRKISKTKVNPNTFNVDRAFLYMLKTKDTLTLFHGFMNYFEVNRIE